MPGSGVGGHGAIVHELASFSACWRSSAHACLDTFMLQTSTSEELAALGAADSLDGNKTNSSGLAMAVVSNTTSEPALELVSLMREGASRMAAELGSHGGGFMWLLALSVSLLVFMCILCVMAMQSCGQRRIHPPRPTGTRWIGAARGPTTGSLSSLSSSWARPSSSARCIGKVLSRKGQREDSSARHGTIPKPKQSATSKTKSTSYPGSSRERYLQDLEYGKGSSARVHRSSFQEAAKQSGGSHFVMPVGDLVAAVEEGSFIVRDTLGSMTLRVAVSQNDEGVRKVQLFLGQKTEVPCVSVGPPSGSQGSLDSLELRGERDMHIGSMTPQSDGSFVVRAQAQPKLIIEGNEDDLELNIRTRDGRWVAKVTCEETCPGGPDQVEIHVLPGIHPILVAACAFATLFLCGVSPDEHGDVR